VLCGELQAKDAPEEVSVRAAVRETLLGWTVWPGWHPPLLLAQVVGVEALTVASALPAAATPGAARGGRVSGSPEPRLPVSVDMLDLLAPARRSTSASAPLAYAEQDDDQVGFLSVASTLFTWAEDLREHRGRGEGLPDVSISSLAEWLLNRIDEACDDHPAIDELYDDLRKLYGALRAQLGQIDIPDYRHGIPCPKCQRLSLVRQAGGDYVVCSECGAYLKITEYEEYVMTMATALSTEEREKRRKAAADRRALVRLLREMHAVGWRHSVRWEAPAPDLDDPPPGAGSWRHDWTRGGECIRLYIRTGDNEGGGWIQLGRIYGVAFFGANVHVEVEWIVENGVARLHRLATAAGVLSVPKERAA
jgi:ribosomal protein L37AE/L43A